MTGTVTYASLMRYVCKEHNLLCATICHERSLVSQPSAAVSPNEKNPIYMSFDSQIRCTTSRFWSPGSNQWPYTRNSSG